MSSPNLATTGYRPQFLAFLYPLLLSGGSSLPKGRPCHTRSDPRRSAAGSVRQMDNIFITALAKACTCAQHTSLVSSQGSLSRTCTTHHKPRRRYEQAHASDPRRFHNSPSLAGRPSARRSITREDYKHMVDYYREPYTTQAAWVQSEPSVLGMPLPPVENEEIGPQDALPEEAVPEKAVLGKAVPEEAVPEEVVPEEAVSKEFGQEESFKSDGSTYSQEVQDAIEALVRVLGHKDATQETVFDAYSALPFPGVIYLPKKTRRLLFHRLSIVEMKSQKSSMRFLSVIDDMKAADLPITEAEWNSAIAFTGRCFVQVTAVEVEAAIRMWKEMEQEAGVKSGHVTFNILFDIATKAGKFVLAEMILREMANRRMPLNRFARTGLIYYYGLKGDGQGVRRAYRELVDAGYIVDTVVMDCVVVSLLKAGELPAAEQVYERMKHMFARKTGAKVPFTGWKETRDLGRILNKAERVFKTDAHKLQQLQDEQLLAPGLRTYTILVDHHVSVTGELRQVIRLLDEMQLLGVPLHGKIFSKLFKGFAYHGGIKYTSWTRARLESVWTALGSVLDSQVEDVQLQKWMVVWIMRAFAQCCGRARALEVWAELKTRWKADVGEFDSVLRLLRDVLTPSNVPEDDYGD